MALFRDLLEDWRALAARFREAPSVALFLDFDGTLAPLADDPRDAVIDRAARSALLRLARNPHVHTWVVSGRRQADLRELVSAVPRLTYLGVHGGDAAGTVLPQEVLRAVQDAQRDLVSGLNGTLPRPGSGILIEDKGVAFAVHHRGAGDVQVTRAREALDRVVGKLNGALRIVPGDRVWEVLPREIRGKGDSVRREWRGRSPSALPIYIGNDGTDESAFAALAEGVTARVGAAKPTRARYALRDCTEVARFLETLEKEMRWRRYPASNS